MWRTLTFSLLILLLVSCHKKEDAYIQPQILLPTLATHSAIQIINTKATLSAEIQGNLEAFQIEKYGFIWAESPNISLDNAKSLLEATPYSSLTLKQYQITLDSLKLATTYYYRSVLILASYASKPAQSIIYGNERSFTTAHRDAWSYSTKYPGPFSANFVFNIDDKLYMGVSWETASRRAYNDFWQYDPTLNKWTRKADFPGYVLRSSHTMFSVNGKGYVGMGLDTAKHLLKDVWEYDPLEDKWSQKQDFPGGGRLAMAAFTIGDKVYAGTGNTQEATSNEFWQYDSQADRWTKKKDFPGVARVGTITFTINGKGYLGTGNTMEGNSNDFWEYDPSMDHWTRKANVEGVKRKNAFGFSLNGKGYIGGGEAQEGMYQNDFWEYDPKVNGWTQKSNLLMSAVGIHTALGLKGRGYIWNGDKFNEYLP